MKAYDENLIDRSVLFVVSSFEKGSKSKIVTKHGVLYSPYSALSLINKACMLYASTYDGRVKATRHNLQQHKKTTILISEDGVAAYPTKSPTHPECVWIFNQEYRIEFISPTKTRLIYDQYQVSAEVNVSIHTLQKQRTRMHEMLYYYMRVRGRHNT
ncbi:competence protein ComK [Planococcus sp. YIM B11945]|uniref:competence protein ComK n=1 Tax=Planococcus sp. YIM B11945 TaxID=3435410 RepID=UPI003D7EFC44